MTADGRGAGPPSDPERFAAQVRELQRLLSLAEVYYRRWRFENELVRDGQQPAFRVSWSKLRDVGLALPEVDFRSFNRRLKRLARSQSAIGAQAYREVSSA